MGIEALSFELVVARTLAQLADARAVRASAYGHHVPELAHTMRQPDPIDLLSHTVVLLARDKASGAPLGTARIATNARRPLLIERSYVLPDGMRDGHLAEITRLAVAPAADDRLVKRALMKACYLVCQALQVQKMVIGARSAALIRGYRDLGFECLTQNSGPVPLAHAGGLAHHVLAFDVPSAERVWHAISHPLHTWMVRTFHPDIDVSPAPNYDPTGESRSPNPLGPPGPPLRRRTAEPSGASASPMLRVAAAASSARENGLVTTSSIPA